MIAWLRGRLLEKTPSRLIVDVAGVGYEVFVPLSTFLELGPPGHDVTLRVHTHVREDQIALFGFRTAFELATFERLIGVSGIGPRLALVVLSGIEPQDLVRAVQRGDIARLTAIPGIGKKTAERITLELRDRLPAPADEDQEPTAAAGPQHLRDDLASALGNLGYQRLAVEKVLDRVLGATVEPSFEQALRTALRELGTRA